MQKEINAKNKYKEYTSSQEWNVPHLGRIFFARLFDIVLSSIPMIILFFTYKAENWKTAVVVTSTNLIFLFFYFVVLTYFLKGNTIGKLIFNLRILKENKKITFWDIFLREIYFTFIPIIIQIIFQIIIITVFWNINKDNNEKPQGKETIKLLQNISYLFYVCWYLYIIITISLQKQHQTGFDMKRKIFVKHKIKKLTELKKEKLINKKHTHLKDDRPGLINLNELDFLKEKYMNKFENSLRKINELVEKKYYTGAVFVVSKNKKVIFKDCIGINDTDINEPMKENLLFKAYSMTKPLTVVAFFILVQRGLISLETKLEDIYEDFKNIKVFKDHKTKETESIKNKITMKHLLTMTAGFTYHGMFNQTEKLTSVFLNNFEKNNEVGHWDYNKFCKELAKVPLAFQPGTSWYYGIGLDVLSAVIEKVSGQKFYEFVKETIFDKLDMKDSAFNIFDRSREACVYNLTTENEINTLTKNNNFEFLFQDVHEQTPIALGGSGLITTANDYNVFLNFLLDGKDKNGNELLELRLINEISKDQIKELKKDFRWTLNEDYSYGYGVRVRIKNENYPLTAIGEFGWGGLLGSTALVDPKNKITMTIMLSSKPGNNKIIEHDFLDAFYKDLKEEKLI
ncbi:serine hydrolase [Spiroplasma tabanidicola]|uniref:Serine hydrolase n=1 Tax=Spiroplasma tabanidicola TaxID=324079 RepID=A0A6I6C5Y3_9MOLU|nr:serine hydrolase [Spiroplasma tabanidicola]QGS51550.1 serine hydrolase [Spiroplasma tabanidicola]